MRGSRTKPSTNHGKSSNSSANSKRTVKAGVSKPVSVNKKQSSASGGKIGTGGSDSLGGKMKIASIVNNYIYNTVDPKDKPDKQHYYAVYHDDKSNENRAIPLSHLYDVVSEKKEPLRDGSIMEQKFNMFPLPSAVENYYYSKNTKGRKINFNSDKIKIYQNEIVSDKTAERIKAFAKKDRSK